MKKLLLILALLVPTALCATDYYDFQHYVITPDTPTISNAIQFRGDFRLYDDTITVILNNAIPKVIFYASGTIVVERIEATEVIFHSSTTIFNNAITFSSAVTFTEIVTFSSTTVFTEDIEGTISTATVSLFTSNSGALNGFAYAHFVTTTTDQAITGKKTFDQTITSSSDIVTTYGFFHNRGDPGFWDFILGNFTTDANWYDLDLSTIVPVGAKTILIHVQLTDNASASFVGFRKNGNSSIYNVAYAQTQVSGITNYISLIVPCDSGRIIEYQFSNTTFTAIKLTVGGWWK